jgi:hypothetical protein
MGIFLKEKNAQIILCTFNRVEALVYLTIER